ncbi:MAG: DUF1292 domain-containing protein [Lachnospiraceae bacterium]|nr:DUF1292 domain-containing protein [Lachnospiraceae bacterium]
MEKVAFALDNDELVEFFVLEETKINGTKYILVTESEEDEAEAYILKDLAAEDEADSIYEIVEDENELEMVSALFAELLEDVDIEL